MRLGLDRLQVAAAVNVATTGSHTRTAPALARHAKIETTMAVYTDVTLLDLRGAVEMATTGTARRSEVQ